MVLPYDRHMTTSLTRTLIAYPAPDGLGKWHAANLTGVAACGTPTLVAHRQSDRLQYAAGTSAEKIHPIVCRRCVRNATSPTSGSQSAASRSR